MKMKPNLKPEVKGPMDRFVMKIQNEKNSQRPVLPPVEKDCDKLATSTLCIMPLAQRQLGSASAPSQPPDKQEKKPHATHSFEWCWDGRKPINITCDKAGTVESTLLRSKIFKGIAQKNKGKELVILKDKKAISSHLPCCLIKKERLTVNYIKAGGKPKRSFENRGYISSWRKGRSDKPVMFHVFTRGGKNVVRIMRNPALRTNFQEITVYAYKGEKVKHALRRDGRLLNTVFKKNCALSDTSTDVTTEMSSLVDDLDGKTFKIILHDRSPPPESPQSSLELMESYSPRSDSDANQDPPQHSATTESENDNRPEEKPEPEGDTAPEQNPDTMLILSQLKDLVKRLKTLQASKPSRMQDFYRVEYGKNDQTCREVKTHKKLGERSNSVCHVRINGRPGGSGFLLFDKFVLTNGHVITNVYDEETRQLTERVTVHFSYESLDQMEAGQDSRAEVEEVAGFEYCSDETEHKHDWALLKLSAEQNLPDGLLKHFGFHSQSGGICIIGHPGGGVKKIDPCWIVSFDNRSQVVERHYRENQEHVQLVTNRFFEGAAEWVKQRKQVLTYESSFYFGSSGSPVFDQHCNVVAMHSGGYMYWKESGQCQSVIEYGFPLSAIIEQVIYQLVERGRFDVLKKYLACSYARHQDMMRNLKKLVEGRNLTAFRNAANSPEVLNDPSLKMFFDLLCRPEDSVPMDTE